MAKLRGGQFSMVYVCLCVYIMGHEGPGMYVYIRYVCGGGVHAYVFCMYAMPVCMCVVYCLSSLLCWGNAPCYTARYNMLDYNILYYAS